MPTDDTLLLGLVSISDRAARGEYPDAGLPALEDWFAKALTTPFRV
ncbi:MAG: molybdopterin adenylyltransferase, partial [Burkholderiales bacterium]|nr:molybdopterin adenylyltransferase [Burkholderiales bacterium]